jgi:hypothetical protein
MEFGLAGIADAIERRLRPRSSSYSSSNASCIPFHADDCAEWRQTASSWPYLSPARMKGTNCDLKAEVVKQDLVIEDGKVEAYRTKLKVSFKFEGC